VFENIAEAPVASILRGFSAPVQRFSALDILLFSAIDVGAAIFQDPGGVVIQSKQM
jgi:hypothetical protein